MSGELPEFYFRIKENGAAVFRVETETRNRRIELDQIATVNVNSGAVRPQGDRDLSPEETGAIAVWLDTRRTLLARRALDDIHRAIDHLNLTSQWAQSKASDAELDEVTDSLLLAMHDLRTVLVRRKADRVSREQKAAD